MLPLILREDVIKYVAETWFVYSVIVRLIYWAATYGEEFIVFVLVVAKTILLRLRLFQSVNSIL